MEGAVLFGMEPSAINIRKAKYTIGEGINLLWDEKNILEKEKNILVRILKSGFAKIVSINLLKSIKILNMKKQFLINLIFRNIPNPL